MAEEASKNVTKQDQPDQDWEKQYQKVEEQLLRNKRLATHMMKHGIWTLMCASELEGLAVGKSAQALHWNLAGLGGGHRGKVREKDVCGKERGCHVEHQGGGHQGLHGGGLQGGGLQGGGLQGGLQGLETGSLLSQLLLGDVAHAARCASCPGSLLI